MTEKEQHLSKVKRQKLLTEAFNATNALSKYLEATQDKDLYEVNKALRILWTLAG